jgi:hypothetical protein
MFRQKYRVASTRLPGWDYRAAGYYFVTVCTKAREPFFGDVVVGAMALSAVGNIVAAEWRSIAVRRRDVVLDEWVIMPNHLHGILVRRGHTPVETPHRTRERITPSNGASMADGHPDGRIQRGVSTALRLHQDLWGDCRAVQITVNETHLASRFSRFRVATEVLRSHRPQ